ncbi:YiiX/YebB-like N1pC/P60 family cysteine hydrolase [Flavobacterium sp. DGU11]|uniref:YiiX/YebB-like N1pC/P60 family cysteine hydrolase n=1 Tax=Flavobacterium arundinis TaxID=3139143 RepID=A0ABU9HTV6_9FLAO
MAAVIMKKRYLIKRLFLSMVVLFCFMLMSYKAFFYFDHQSEQKEIVKNHDVTRLTHAEMAQLEEGDFILRRGFGFFSDYISKNLNESATRNSIDVTHAGIIVRRNGALHVIHSLSSDVTNIDGLQIQPLEEFLNYSAPGKIIVTHIKSTDVAIGKKVAKLAESYLEKHIPFDHNGNFDDDKELFCTELIWKILEKDLRCVTLPTEPTARKDFFYSMMPMYDTAYFDIKINQYNGSK